MLRSTLQLATTMESAVGEPTVLATLTPLDNFEISADFGAPSNHDGSSTALNRKNRNSHFNFGLDMSRPSSRGDVSGVRRDQSSSFIASNQSALNPLLKQRILQHNLPKGLPVLRILGLISLLLSVQVSAMHAQT